jgi:hypothetical protein
MRLTIAEEAIESVRGSRNAAPPRMVEIARAVWREFAIGFVRIIR